MQEHSNILFLPYIMIWLKYTKKVFFFCKKFWSWALRVLVSWCIFFSGKSLTKVSFLYKYANKLCQSWGQWMLLQAINIIFLINSFSKYIVGGLKSKKKSEAMAKINVSLKNMFGATPKMQSCYQLIFIVYYFSFFILLCANLNCIII